MWNLVGFDWSEYQSYFRASWECQFSNEEFLRKALSVYDTGAQIHGDKNHILNQYDTT